VGNICAKLWTGVESEKDSVASLRKIGRRKDSQKWLSYLLRGGGQKISESGVSQYPL
jgi:hypothetical protein